MVLMADQGARVVAASQKLAVLRAEGTKRAITGAGGTPTLHHIGIRRSSELPVLE